MSFYQTIWKDQKNRTALFSIILTIGALILAILFAAYDDQTAPVWLRGLYTPEEYNVGLTLLTLLFLCIFYFFVMISIATLIEIRASIPSWGSILASAIISILVAWLVTSVKPREGSPITNYTNAMQWTIFGSLFGFIIVSVVYIFFTETLDEEEKERRKLEKKEKKEKKKKN